MIRPTSNVFRPKFFAMALHPFFGWHPLVRMVHYYRGGGRKRKKSATTVAVLLGISRRA
jgi:hypothetical protein